MTPFKERAQQYLDGLITEEELFRTLYEVSNEMPLQELRLITDNVARCILLF